MPKKSSGKKPIFNEPGHNPAPEDHKPTFFGAELQTVCVAFCNTCQKRVGEETTDRSAAQADADAHVKTHKGHKVELLCSK